MVWDCAGATGVTRKAETPPKHHKSQGQGQAEEGGYFGVRNENHVGGIPMPFAQEAHLNIITPLLITQSQLGRWDCS